MSDLDNEEIEATREMNAINKIIAPEEKTADEMFKELGYEKEFDYDHSYFKVITPFKCNKDICFCEEDIIITETNYDKFGDLQQNVIYLNAKIIQAINKKCKELGWL